MKKIVFALIMLLSISAISQPQLTFRFANAQLVNSDTQLQFDVEVKADDPGWFIYITQLNFTYNTMAFGENISGSGAGTVVKGLLIDGAMAWPPFSAFYSLLSVGDPMPNMVGATAQTTQSATDPGLGYGVHAEWPLTPAWGHVWQVTIDIVDPGQLAGIEFSVIMDGQQSCQTGVVPPATNVVVLGPNIYENDLLTFPLGGGGTTYTWNGSVDGAWDNSANWTPVGIPGADDLAHIPPVEATHPIITGNVVAGTVNLTGTLHIAAGGTLDAMGPFANSGTFLILSAGTASGSFIDHAGITGIGSFQFDRDIVPGTPNPGVPVGEEGWHYVSSPVNNTVSGNFVGYWLYRWDEPAGDWFALDQNPSVFNIPLGVSQGYSIKEDLTYTGPPPGVAPTINFGAGSVAGIPATMADVNTSPVAAPLLPVPINHSGTGPFPNWNLLGNPFPSGWDFDLYINGSMSYVPGAIVGPVIHYYNEFFGQYSTWLVTGPGTGTGTMGGTSFVPPTQGFFIESAAPFGFQPVNTEREHTAAGSFYKSNSNEVRLAVSIGGNISDETLIRFQEEATAGLDVMGDASKLKSGIALYTVAENYQLAINTLPETEMVPMAFEAITSGEYTIEATETGEFADVVLEDLVTGTQTNLLEDSYAFDHTSGADPNRFIVHFTTLGTPELEANSIKIWSNEHSIYVNVPETTTGDIAVYNMMGQQIIASDVAPGLNTFPVQEVNTYYVVKVMTSSNVVTGKVYIK